MHMSTSFTCTWVHHSHAHEHIVHMHMSTSFTCTWAHHSHAHEHIVHMHMSTSFTCTWAHRSHAHEYIVHMHMSTSFTVWYFIKTFYIHQSTWYNVFIEPECIPLCLIKTMFPFSPSYISTSSVTSDFKLLSFVSWYLSWNVYMSLTFCIIILQEANQRSTALFLLPSLFLSVCEYR